jgi:hypothetical protein
MVLGKLLANSINSVSQTHRNCTLYKLLTIYKQQRLIIGQMKGEMGSAMEGTTDIIFFKVVCVNVMGFYVHHMPNTKSVHEKCISRNVHRIFYQSDGKFCLVIKNVIGGGEIESQESEFGIRD